MFLEEQREQGQQEWIEASHAGSVICFATFWIHAAVCDGSRSAQVVVAEYQGRWVLHIEGWQAGEGQEADRACLEQRGRL